jgi:hypothetical protein
MRKYDRNARLPDPARAPENGQEQRVTGEFRPTPPPPQLLIPPLPLLRPVRTEEDFYPRYSFHLIRFYSSLVSL